MTNNDNTIPKLELQSIPHVGQQIFEYVGTPDLLQFRKVSETWKEIAEEVLVKRWRDNWTKAIVRTDLQVKFEALEKDPNVNAEFDGWWFSSLVTNETEYSILKSLMEHPYANNIHDINRMMQQVNLPNRNNLFLYACKFGNLKVVKLLLDYSGINDDFDLNVKDNLEWKLPRKEPRMTGFIWACRNGHIEVVEFLLDQSNIALNIRDTSGKTALHYACSKGRTKIVELLLNHSGGEEIDFNARNNQGRTPFSLACTLGSIDVVRLLMDNSTIKNIDLNVRDDNGWNGLMWCCRFTNPRTIEVVRLLLEHPVMENIDLTICCNSGRTALMLACKHGLGYGDGMVSLLLDHSDSKDLGLNIRDNSGKTAFMIACNRPPDDIRETTRIVRLFLEHSESKNIQLNLRDNDGMTGFLLAYRKSILMASSNLIGYQMDSWVHSTTELLLKKSAEKNIELPFDAQEYPEMVDREIEAEKVRKYFEYLPF